MYVCVHTTEDHSNFFFFLAMRGLCFCSGFSLVEAGYSVVAMWASHCRGFSFCRAQALGHEGFISSGSQASERRLSNCGTWA